jgi:hypothetical protein
MGPGPSLDALTREQVAGRDLSPQVWSDATWLTSPAKDLGPSWPSPAHAHSRKGANRRQKSYTEPNPVVPTLGLSPHRTQVDGLRNRAIEVRAGNTSECPESPT